MGDSRRAPQEVSITTLTLVTLLVVAIGVTNRRGYAWALALGGVTPVGAAVASGNVALPTFYAVALGAAAGLVLRTLFTRPSAAPPPAVPGGLALVLLVLVALVVTLGAPIIFDNTYVLSPGAPSRLAAGVVTKSNIAQLLYLTLGVSVVYFLARARWVGVQLIGFTVCATTALSFWAYLGTTTGIPYPVGFFDNSPAFVYQETLPGGGMRVRGILSEPAALATSSLATIVYGAARLNAVSGVRRAALVLTMAAAAYLGSISTSATFFVAGAGLLVVALVLTGGSVLFRRRRLGSGAVAAACGAAVAAVWVLPLLTGLLAGVIDDKVASASFDERSYSDDYSYELVRRTLGLGVGLGSNRASSFLPSLLSTVGVLGTALFFGSVVAILRSSWPDRTVRPAAWVLFAYLVSKFISGPDLADTSGLIWMTLGVMAAAGIERARAQRESALAVPATATRSANAPTPPGAARRAAERQAHAQTLLVVARPPRTDQAKPVSADDRRTT